MCGRRIVLHLIYDILLNNFFRFVTLTNCFFGRVCKVSLILYVAFLYVHQLCNVQTWSGLCLHQLDVCRLVASCLFFRLSNSYLASKPIVATLFISPSLFTYGNCFLFQRLFKHNYVSDAHGLFTDILIPDIQYTRSVGHFQFYLAVNPHRNFLVGNHLKVPMKRKFVQYFLSYFAQITRNHDIQ